MDETELEAALVGGDVSTQALLKASLAAAAVDVHVHVHVIPASAYPPVASRGHGVDLLIVIAGRADDEDDQLSPVVRLHRLGYRPALLVLVDGVSPALRRRAFALGARDVIGLPPAPRELRARLRAVLRRIRRERRALEGGDTVNAGGLTLRVATREVEDGAGWRVRLTRREVAVLAPLMRRPGQVVGRAALLGQAYSEGYDGDADTLDVYLRRLLMKLARPSVARDPLLIHVEGYVFDARARPRETITIRRGVS